MSQVVAFRTGELVQIVSLNLIGVIGEIWQGADDNLYEVLVPSGLKPNCWQEELSPVKQGSENR